MTEIRKKAAIPPYGAALVWLLYCLFFPLYSFLHFAIVILLAALCYVILSKLFPGTVEKIVVPEKPAVTGDEKVDALLAEGRQAVNEMKRLRDSIADKAVQDKISEIIDVTDRIFKDLLDDPGDYDRIKRFSGYYLPTTIKLLNAYDRFYSQGIDGENISSTLARINDILDTTIAAYKKQLDALFADQALDIETDITVLESMLKREGLSGKDF